MRVVIHDFSPLATTLMGELSMMRNMCVTYEDIIDFQLLHRDDPLNPTYYEDYMVDVFCELKHLDHDDIKLVKAAYYRLKPLVDSVFPFHSGYWLCCGFVGMLGYFIHSTDAAHHEMQNLRQSVILSIRSLRGYYDSCTADPGF